MIMIKEHEYNYICAKRKHENELNERRRESIHKKVRKISLKEAGIFQ